MKQRIIVSLTSFPGGMGVIVPTLKSLLKQSLLPEKIVLYLADPEFPDRKIPENLETLARENPILDIRYYPTNIRSYKKLIPALEDFPNEIIITVDDDALYPPDLIKRLIAEHKKYPDSIIAHRTRRMIFDKKWNLLPYKSWKIYKHLRYFVWGSHPKYTNFFTGTGGVLYPPHALHPDATKEEFFMNLAPTADDVWFWAMAVRKNTKIKPVFFGFPHITTLEKPDQHKLTTFNLVDDRNVKFANAIMKKFPEILEIIQSAKN
ncbi:glycosyltransferase family A protein [Ideonella dechloratans]|uniref:glycosyltransferase family A protein n=1 Tax=Ideonella dechloratans TaxID=36863 RepID=UPI0035AF88FF